MGVMAAMNSKTLDAFVAGTVDVIRKTIAPRDAQIASLLQRVAELESKKLPTYAGAHKEGTAYAAGSLVTRSGSLWLATAQTDETPGQGATSWRLIVKRGEA
jgi:hypothetical protein